MSQPVELSPELRAVLACVDQFMASDETVDQDLRKFLTPAPPEFRTAAMVELVKAEMERDTKRGAPRPLELYFDRYPEYFDSLNASFHASATKTDAENRTTVRDANAEMSTVTVATPSVGIETKISRMDTVAAEESPDSGSGPPERIGKHTLVRRLGKGGFGAVYLYRDELLHRDVAIKLRHGAKGQRGLSDDLLNEARSIAQLNHPNIVRLCDADNTSDGLGYVIYEFIEGESLQARITRSKDYPYTFDQAAEWVATVADALVHAHQKKIIHRDIKSANIMLDSSGRPKIVNFGLSRRDDSFYMTDKKRILGTLAYMSPEQAMGNSNWAGPQADLYSLGVVLYELLCRRRPFSGTNEEEMLEQVRHRVPDPPRSINDAIPEKLEHVCLKALKKSAEDRFTTGDAMARAIREAIAPPGKPEPTPWWQRPMRVVSGLVAVLSALVLLGVFLGIIPPQPPQASEAPPTFNGYKLLVDRVPAIVEVRNAQQLPLRGNERLHVQATFDQPAYGCLILYPQDAEPSLLWPTTSALDKQAKQDRLIYPPPDHQDDDFSLPDEEGASLIVVLASRKPFTKAALDGLLKLRLNLGISPEIASSSRNLWVLANPSPKGAFEGVLRSPKEPVVSEEFKDQLTRAADAHHGLIVSHEKSSEGP